jgi:putative phosphoribosyl transferase
MFQDRRDAGRQLARKLTKYAGRQDVVVLALPRGGVPVAYEVAQVLKLSWDLFFVRKIGVPGQEELAMGAIASGGVEILNQRLIERLGLSDADVQSSVRAEQTELSRREQLYWRPGPALNVQGRTVILIDDGLATGATMLAAVEAIRQQGAAEIVVAVPVGSPRTCSEFRKHADDAVCAETPSDFHAVGQWYADFTQVTDEEVRDLLRRNDIARSSTSSISSHGAAPSVRSCSSPSSKSAGSTTG